MTTATQLAPAPRPGHVPEDLVFDFDLYDGPGLGGRSSPEIHAEWKAWQDGHPAVFWTPSNGGHWALTRWDVIRRAALGGLSLAPGQLGKPRGREEHLAPRRAPCLGLGIAAPAFGLPVFLEAGRSPQLRGRNRPIQR